MALITSTTWQTVATSKDAGAPTNSRSPMDDATTPQKKHLQGFNKNRPDAKVHLPADLGRYTTIPTSDSTRVCLGTVGSVCLA
jgi:hypothetical protein